MEKKVTLSFDPIEHKYSDETGLVYTSVTTVIGKYKKPFDKEYWSMYTALKNAGCKVIPNKDCTGIVVNGKYQSIGYLLKHPIYSYEAQEVLMKWSMLTEEACARGNEVHDFLEDSINLSKDDIEGKSNDVIQPSLNTLGNTGLVIIKTEHDLSKTKIEERFPAVCLRLKKFIGMGCTIFAEKKIYSTTYQLAGMIDVLIVQGKKFAILDWKTNKDEMLFSSGYYKKVKMPDGTWVRSDQYVLTGDKLLYPLNKVEACKGMIYSLQLSLYAFIMELWGYELVENGLEIFHMRPGLDPKLIKIKYMRQEVQQMLEHHLTTRILKKPVINPNLFGIR